MKEIYVVTSGRYSDYGIVWKRLSETNSTNAKQKRREFKDEPI